MVKKILVAGFLLVYCAAAYSQGQVENTADYAPLNLHLSTVEYLRLAAAEPTDAATTDSATSSKSDAVSEGSGTDKNDMEYENRWLTANKVHKWLGIGSLALAVASVIAPKEEDGLHHELAQGAAALGGLAAVTGLFFHYDDLSATHFFSNPDNWHAILATLGAVGYALAVDNGGESGHAEAGVAGMVFMIGGIKMTW